MAIIVIIVVTSLSMLVTIMGVLARRLLIVKATDFTAVCTKMIMTNQLDRLIKICNTNQEAPFLKAVKNLCLQANRPYSLELAYHEALLILRDRDDRDQRIKFTTNLSYVVTLFMMALAAYAIANPEDRVSLGKWFAGLVFVNILGSAITLSVSRHYEEARKCLLSIRNTLYDRAKYVPPQYQPRPMTPEEIGQWRQRMEAFEASIVEQCTKGGNVNVIEEHDRQVDREGVLPPL